MAKASFQLKISALILFYFLAFPFFAQNGIPLGALRDNPYFADGTDFEIVDEEVMEQYEEEQQPQYSDPGEEYFYNEENWTLETDDVDSAFSSDGIPQQEDNPEAPYVPDDEIPMESDQNIRDRLRGEEFYASHFNVNAGYQLTGAFSFTDSDIGSYFFPKSIIFPQVLGADLNAEAVLSGTEIRFGIGFSGDWSMPFVKTASYSIIGQEIDTGLYFFLQFRLKPLLVMSVHAGGGLLFLIDCKTIYSNGLVYYLASSADPETGEVNHYEKPDDNYFMYPEVFIGADVKYYFSRHFGAGGQLDIRYPFAVGSENALSPFYTRMQLSVQAVWRF